MAFLDKINREKFLQYSIACGIAKDDEHEDLVDERDEILGWIAELDSLTIEEDDEDGVKYIRAMVDGLDDLEDMLDDFDSDVKDELGRGSILKRKEAVRTLRRRIRKTKRASKSARRKLGRWDFETKAEELGGIMDQIVL
ncbi:MAG: hypothetical protein AAF502_16030 [Bacteroidota bacterium]